jgi:hypothetical protein
MHRKHGQYGVWRSPVARLLWEQEVPGSNPGAPMWFLAVLLPQPGVTAGFLAEEAPIRTRPSAQQ